MGTKNLKQEFKQFTAVSCLDNLETLKALFYHHSFGRHYHEGYAIGVILAGSETYQCNQKTNVAPKGSIVTVNPGEVHNGHASDSENGWGYFMIYPHLRLIKKALAQLGLPRDRLPWFPSSVVIDPLVEAGLVQLMAACEAGDGSLALESHFLSLLALMIQRHAGFKIPKEAARNDGDRVKRVTEMVHSMYNEPLSLDALARDAGVSAYSLLRLFKKQTGISPYLMQTGLKLKHAKRKLLSGISIADTAADCGFTDQSHMTRQFKRWMGVTPGDYQKGGRPA